MSFDLVLFGGTGDLAWRKLLPALFQSFRHGSLPADGRIIGVGRNEMSDDDYRALIAQRLAEVEAVVVENNVTDFVLGKAKVSEKAVSFDELMGQQA